MIEVAEQQTVGNEPGFVFADHRLFADLLGENPNVLDNLIVGDDGANDFHEILHGSRVEEVQSHHARRLADRRGNFGDRQRGGVRAPNDSIGQEAVELAENLAFQLQVLGYRFDHDVRRQRLLQVGREKDAIENSGSLTRGQFVAGHRSVGGGFDALTCIADGGVVDVDSSDGEAVSRDYLSYSGPHGSQADNCNTADPVPRFHECSLPKGQNRRRPESAVPLSSS